MGLASFGLEIGIFCEFLHCVLLLSAILGLDFLGLALSRPQVLGTIYHCGEMILTGPHWVCLPVCDQQECVTNGEDCGAQCTDSDSWNSAKDMGWMWPAAADAGVSAVIASLEYCRLTALSPGQRRRPVGTSAGYD
jgi:hypothetical protein